MTMVASFDPADERALLDGWIDTTGFDVLPTGIPALDPEDDDEDDPATNDAGGLVPAGVDGALIAAAYDDEHGVSRDRVGRFAEHPAAEVTGALLAGGDVSCDPGDIGPLMNTLAAGDGPSCNLARLQVRGSGNENCFQHHLRDIPRSQMPQLGTTVEKLQQFTDRLQAMGVTATLEDVDPRALQATQSQLDAKKVAILYGQFVEAGGWRVGSVLVTSNDGAVLDGHHRWAAAAATAIAGRPMTVTVLRVDLGIDALLEVANVSSGPRKDAFVASGGVFGGEPSGPPPDGNEAWLQFDGRWVLAVTDTADGVPDELSFTAADPTPGTSSEASVPVNDDGTLIAAGDTIKRDRKGRFAEVEGRGGGVALTNAEFDARQKMVEDAIGKARKTLATELVYAKGGAWEPDRDRLHRQIATELYAAADHVPNEGKAVIAGGLAGAGKSTVLRDHSGISAKNYLTVNPDDIKEEMARRGLIPEVPDVPGLLPMERAALVHDESSRIGLLLADMAYRDRKNVIWDVTMSSEGSARSRVDALSNAGYTEIKGVFVDIPVEVSVERALSRYRNGIDDWVVDGKGYGGRYVPPSIIRAQRTGTGRTINRDVFEALHNGGVFTDWAVYDNSVTGRAPQLVTTSGQPFEALAASLTDWGTLMADSSTVAGLLDELAAGSVGIDAVAAAFAARTWPVAAATTDAAAWGVADDPAPDPESWATVNADSRLTPDQYQVLSTAYQSAGRYAVAHAGLVPVNDDGTLVASAAVRTGAMIALIPSDTDAQRIAVDGGEPVDELHTTLLYLGEAADISEELQAAFVAAVTAAVAGTPPVPADGFSISLFNPDPATDPEPCVVLLMSGTEIDFVHGAVCEAVTNVAGDAMWELPEQHQPYHPHITLQYLGDLDQAGLAAAVARLVDRVGPVTYDRVRVVFAGDATDIPLGVQVEPISNEEQTMADHLTAAPAIAPVLATEPEPVVAPKVAPATPGVCPDGQHYDETVGECVPDAAPADEHFHAIMHVEGVTTGLRTFQPGSLTWRDPPFAFHWQVKSSAHGGTPETVHVGNITRVVRDGNTLHGWGRLDLGCPEGVEYARRLIEGFARWSSIGLDEYPTDVELVWPEGEGGGDDDEVGVLFAEPEQMIFHAGRIGELTAVSTPAQDAAVIDPLPALTEALATMGVAVAVPAPAPAEALIAAGYTITIPDLAPAWWFDAPDDVLAHGALTITDEGRVYGYLAPAEIAHRSFRDRRVTVPMGRVDYSRWMGGEALVAGGRVVAGPITMECGHLPPSASSHPVIRMDHYENSCSVVAKARVGENRHGVWIAGALEPGVSAEQVSRMLACRLSGDWAPHPERQGWQELCAALLVPVPGFPMARSTPSVRVTDGALVASSVPVRIVAADADLAAGPDLRPVLERVARSIGRDAPTRLEALHSRVHAAGSL